VCSFTTSYQQFRSVLPFGQENVDSIPSLECRFVTTGVSSFVVTAFSGLVFVIVVATVVVVRLRIGVLLGWLLWLLLCRLLHGLVLYWLVWKTTS